MKYMGSKRSMLLNGLGSLLETEISGAVRFVDLFTGSGAVGIHVAQKYPVSVIACDLQIYSSILSMAVIGREGPLDCRNVLEKWFCNASRQFHACEYPVVNEVNPAGVEMLRIWCESQSDLPITKAYGGHYFSPQQSVWIDALRANLPSSDPDLTVALAALIQAASCCAASPGHTAQPFQPTPTAKRFIEDAWRKDIVKAVKSSFKILAVQFAQRAGKSFVNDANTVAQELQPGDLAFIDPPYSGVHYSRFYHVLETIAQGKCGDVSGVGRYPAFEFRPRSKYSVVSESTGTLDELLNTIACRGARAIMTFPDHDCSNGLSGNTVRAIAQKHFHVREKQVTSRFSSLGGIGNGHGNEAGRSARRNAQELILIMKPK